MVGRTNAGGGGAGLNFKIIGGTTQPASTKENAIWVNTENNITGWEFSAEQPASPAAGMVWIQTGTSSAAAFNAIKKNSLWVYPLSCRQYVNGTWVNKEVKTYQNGGWASWWSGELYDAGNEYTQMTGGWVSFEPLQYNGGTATKNEASLYVEAPQTGNGWPSIAWATAQPIDLSDFTTLHILATSASGGSGDSCTKFGITDTYNTSSWNDTPNAVFNTGETTLDISSVNSGYIWFGAAARATAKKTATVTKIWLT